MDCARGREFPSWSSRALLGCLHTLWSGRSNLAHEGHETEPRVRESLTVGEWRVRLLTLRHSRHQEWTVMVLNMRQPSKRNWGSLLLLVLAAFEIAAPGAFAQSVNVLTRNYNNQRTGANLSESTLTTSNVAAGQFGKLFMVPVDDEVYAAILYVSSLQIAGGTHNVIYVATMNNSVYAFDADTLGAPLWSRNFNGSGQPEFWTQVGLNGTCTANQGNIGILSTPVIDGTAGTIYFVTRTVETTGVVQRLHALDITTGNERANSPTVITATVGSNVFTPASQNQRASLALSQGVVYITWASFCDVGPYNGWVMAYNSTSLAQVGALPITERQAGGIWMAAAAPVFDSAGNLYFATGNGTWDGASQFGESLVKLAPTSLGVLDYFTPSE